MGHLLFGFTQILFFLFLFLAAGAIGRGISKGKSADMPRTNKVVRIVETILLFSAGLVFFIYLSCFNNGMLLHLDKLRPAFATTHIVIAVIAIVFLFISALLTWFGRTSIAVILMVIVLVSYSAVIDKTPFQGPGYIMVKIAPEDSWVPIVNYNFKVNGGLENAEVWINGVYLGKTPLEMTGDEFNNKVPFLREPPEGYEKAPGDVPQEEWKSPAGDWFKINLTCLEARNSSPGQGKEYLTEFKDYYAKIKFADEWGKDCTGTSGGSGDFYQYDFEVSLRGHFSITDKLEHEKEERFRKLLQKARLADYKVESDWFEAIDTYGEDGFNNIQKLAKTENGLTEILDSWAKWKYGIGDTLTQKQAESIFNQVYDNIDTRANSFLSSRAINIIYDKLNVEWLVKRYEKIISNRSSNASNLQIGIIRQALKRWDTKLNNEKPDELNLIEKRLVPALIVNGAFDYAVTFGGPEIDMYMIRQYQKNPEIEGIELGSENSEYTMGMHINKWLLNLAYEDLPLAKKFRKNNRDKLFELARLMTNNNFNHSKEPPAFLFKDIELGEKSMAYEYWPEYSAQVESSFSGWWYDKLKRRWQYLSKLGSLATEQMYLDCWLKTKELSHYVPESSLIEAIDAIRIDKRIPVAKEIIKDIQKEIDSERAKLSPEQARYRSFPQKSTYITAIRKSLAKIGDEESIQLWFSKLNPGPDNFEPQRFKEMVDYENMGEGPIIKALAQSENPDLRILSLYAIRKFSTRENREFLEKLTNDSNEEVRKAAIEVANELEQIRNISVDDLVSEPRGK